MPAYATAHKVQKLAAASQFARALDECFEVFFNIILH